MTGPWIYLDDPSEFVEEILDPELSVVYSPALSDVPRAVRAASSSAGRTISIEFLYLSSDEDRIDVDVDSGSVVTIGRKSGRLYGITCRSGSLQYIDERQDLWGRFLDTLQRIHEAVLRDGRSRRTFWDGFWGRPIGPKPADLNYGATEQAMNYRRSELEAVWTNA